MKSMSVDAGINGMIEAGLNIDREKSKERIYEIYESKGYEYQEVFDDFLSEVTTKSYHKYLAAAIVSYRKIKDATMVLYPNVNSTLIALSKWGLKIGVVSDAPSREAWMRICSVNLHHIFDAVVTFHDTGAHKPSSAPFIKISTLLDVSPHNSIMVGDWPERDVFGAQKVGMKTAFAKYGDVFNTTDSGADYDILDIKEILSIVKSENKI